MDTNATTHPDRQTAKPVHLSPQSLARARSIRAQQLKGSERPNGGRQPLTFAIVGLGYIAQSAVIPAFAQIKRHARIAAFVSNDLQKLKALSLEYEVPRTYSYDEYDDCLASGIDAVYVALPNDQHREYAMRAARAGIHVLCEKPMSMTSAEAQSMITEADRHGASLMVAYRVHFDPANELAREIAQSGKIGDLRYFQSTFSMQVRNAGYRINPNQGGGPLGDLGIYCINAARNLFAAEPLEVMAMSARGQDERFRHIDEMVSVLIKFPHGRQALFTASFGAHATSSYRVVGTKGSISVDPAYDENTGATVCTTIGKRTTTRTFKDCDQFAAEIQHFAQCIATGRDPEPSGSEGLSDIRVIEAIERSLRTNRVVALKKAAIPKRRRPRRQATSIPLRRKQEHLVKTVKPDRDP